MSPPLDHTCQHEVEIFACRIKPSPLTLSHTIHFHSSPLSPHMNNKEELEREKKGEEEKEKKEKKKKKIKRMLSTTISR